MPCKIAARKRPPPPRPLFAAALHAQDAPATLPDGQGQSTNIDVGSADRVEVLRGPFSALYGYSSGCVIQVFTEDGEAPPRLGFSAAA